MSQELTILTQAIDNLVTTTGVALRSGDSDLFRLLHNSCEDIIFSAESLGADCSDARSALHRISQAQKEITVILRVEPLERSTT